MKPTRNIVKVNKGLWTPKHAVWFKKNDDGDDDDKKVKLPKGVRFKTWAEMRKERGFEDEEDTSGNSLKDINNIIGREINKKVKK